MLKVYDLVKIKDTLVFDKNDVYALTLDMCSCAGEFAYINKIKTVEVKRKSSCSKETTEVVYEVRLLEKKSGIDLEYVWWLEKWLEPVDEVGEKNE